MKKARGSWTLVTVRAMQKSIKETNRWKLVLLAFLCVFVLGLNSSVFAATFCPESCTVTILDYGLSFENFPNKSNGSVPLGEWNDLNCSTFSATISLQSPAPSIYQIWASKYYWNGVSWTPISSYSHYAVGSQLSSWLPGASFVKDWGSQAAMRWTNPMSLYPNGCPDLPSQQPTNTPNLDPGDPTCNQTSPEL